MLRLRLPIFSRYLGHYMFIPKFLKSPMGGDFFCFCNRRDLISLHMCGTPHKLQILIMNEEIIRVLDFPENVRAKWGMYIDSANSCLREILDNATDESFTWKGCTEIMIDTDFNGYNLVADNGRGIPISMSQDRPGQTQADVSISVLHSGSKFTSAGVATVGTHGVGSACANALAEHYVLLSRITADNYDRSIPAVKNLWESKGPRSRKNLYYFTEYRCGYKTQEGADTLENIENVLWGNLPKGYRSIPLGYSTIVLFKPDPAIWGSNIKTELPIQNIRNFLLIQEKFYKRKVTVIANGEVMSGSGFTPYQFEILRSIIPADPSANPEVKVYITFDIDKSTLGPKQTDASMNGLQCSSGIHLQYAENCFESALKTEYKIKHRMLTPGLRMFALFLADDVQYSGQTKERCKSISKVKITDFADVVKDFQKIFRSNPEYWESHVAVLEQLAESVKNLTASEKAEKLQVGTGAAASFKLRNELGSKLVDATCGPSERWNAELFLCFTGDTTMITSTGEKISLIDLSDRIQRGEEIYTFSCCPETGKIRNSKILAARQVGVTDELCEVTLDNGETIKCTPDHKFLLRSGLYQEAKNLKSGDNLMSFSGMAYSKDGDDPAWYLAVNHSEGLHVYGYHESNLTEVEKLSIVPIPGQLSEITGTGAFSSLYSGINRQVVRVINYIKVDSVPVYCLEVEAPEHNFPLAAGIFTKNCEGLSAAGSLIKGRKSSKYHAVAPLRGRVLNVDGLSVDKMLENKEFYTIFKSIGLGLDINNVATDSLDPMEAFEKIKKSSRYGKIIISTDAD